MNNCKVMLNSYRNAVKGKLVCGICKKRILHKSDVTVDHIVPQAKGGKGDFSNLQPAHIKCNLLKADTLLHPSELPRNYTGRRKMNYSKQGVDS